MRDDCLVVDDLWLYRTRFEPGKKLLSGDFSPTDQGFLFQIVSSAFSSHGVSQWLLELHASSESIQTKKSSEDVRIDD